MITAKSNSVIEITDGARSIELEKGQRVTLGRAFDRLNLNNPFISGGHMRIVHNGTEILLIDGIKSEAL